MPTILEESTTIADSSPGKYYHQTHSRGRKHVMGRGLILFIVFPVIFARILYPYMTYNLLHFVSIFNFLLSRLLLIIHDKSLEHK